MDFSTSLHDVKLDDQETLVAKCENSRHEWELSAFPLNEYLGNNDGHFVWRWQGFKQTARNVYLRDSRFLHAELENAGGGWNATSVDLSEYIENQDGALWCKDEKQEFLAGDDWHLADCYVTNEASGLCLDLAGGWCNPPSLWWQ
jgi:CVNH domain